MHDPQQPFPRSCKTGKKACALDDAVAVLCQRPHDVAARNELAKQVTPILRQRTRRVLASRARMRGETLREHDAADLLQEVLLLWWTHVTRLLAAWDPERGLSLSNFFGLFAERSAISLLRGARRNGLLESPTSPDLLDAELGSQDQDQVTEARQYLGLLLDRLDSRVSVRALAVFQALVLQEQSVKEAAAQLGTSETSVYTTLSRTRAALRQIAREVMEERSPA